MLPLARSSTFAVLLAFAATASSGHAQTSRNATLLANMDLHSRYTGVWSYIHHDGREYAAIGAATGTSIVRLTTPSAPVEVAFIPGVTAGTRDVRQYRNYLYIVANFTSGVPAGIQIIDMSDPDVPTLVSTYTATVQTAEYVNVDTTRALLFANEANQNTEIGGTHILSLADPVSPVEVGTYTPPYRIHDFHPRGNVGYGCAIDNQSVDIVDISNPANPTLISSFTTPFLYPHSSWATADGSYLLVTQEWFFRGDFGRPSVFDVRNPSNVILTYSFNDLPGAVSHIPVIHGNLAAVSYYSAGVRLFDLSVPSQPVEFGFYDTWPGDDFLLAGCYQAAALFPSGLVCAADDLTGLYVIQPDLTYGIVRGLVRDAGGGMKPLGGVTVRVLPDGPSTTTAADGSYALAPPPGAAVSVAAAKYGYAQQTATVTVATASDQMVNFALSSQPTGSVKGTVQRSLTGTSLAGADVSILDAPFTAVTGSRGTYSFSKVATGPAVVRVEYPGLIPITTPVTIAGGKAASANFSLQPAPFYDDAELDRGWTLSDPTDDATQGRWVRGAPIGTFNGSVTAEPSEDHSPAGTFCFVTGNNSSNASLSRVAGGKTTLISPVLDLSSVPDPRIVFWRWYYHNAPVGATAGASQPFLTEISNDGGTSWTEASRLQRERGAWDRVEIRVTDFFAAPALVRVRFTAQNRLPGTIVEAGIDDFEYYAGGAMVASRGELGEQVARAAALRLRGTAARESGIEFRLEVERPGMVDAVILDVRGRRVATVHHGTLASGTHRLIWDGRSDRGGRTGSGVYFLRAVSGGSETHHKFVLLR